MQLVNHRPPSVVEIFLVSPGWLAASCGACCGACCWRRQVVTVCSPAPAHQIPTLPHPLPLALLVLIYSLLLPLPLLNPFPC